MGRPCQFILYLSQLVIILFPRRLFHDLHHRLYPCCLVCSSKWDNLVIHLNKCLLLSSDRSRLVESNIYILCILRYYVLRFLQRLNFINKLNQLWLFLCFVVFQCPWQCENKSRNCFISRMPCLEYPRHFSFLRRVIFLNKSWSGHF